MRLRILFTAVMLVLLTKGGIGQMKIGNNVTAIKSGSVLEMETTDKGILFPRISLTSTSVWAPVAGTAVQGMVVFNTNAAVSGGAGSGIYFWDNNKWNAINTNLATDLSTELINLEDFLFDAYAGAGTNDNQYAFTTATSNGTSGIDGSPTSTDYGGAHILTTGTTSTGRASLGSFNNVNRMVLGGLQIVYEIRVRIDATLSDAANAFTTYLGMMDGILAGAPVNGVYFTYSHTPSPNWIVNTRSGSVSTSVTSNVAVNANQWYKLKAIINAAGTNVDFYIDNVFVGNSTTNIPTGTGKAQRFVFKIEKTAGTLSRQCSIDYITWKMIR